MTEKRKLYRSSTEKMLGGICGGLGEYFDVDPVLVRIAFVALAFIGGTGIPVYFLLWIVIPKDMADSETSKDNLKEVSDEIKEGVQNAAQTIKKHTKRGNNKILIAYVLLFVGIAGLTNEFFSIRLFKWGILWPVFFIIISIFILYNKEDSA